MQDQHKAATAARPIRVSVELPERFDGIGIARRIGRSLLEHCQEHARDVDETETVIGELCGNAARHARSADGWYQCVIEHHGDCVVVSVIDKGIGFNPDDAALMGVARQDVDGSERHGGFGLLLVRSLADLVEFTCSEPQGTTVRARKRLQGSVLRELR